MADLNENVAYLSQEIGPRPAGTEEEQRAALYISEKLSSATGFPTVIEDFQCNPDSSLPRTICSAAAVLATLVATIVSVVSVPAVIVSLACAALLAAEVFGKPVISRFLNRGASQNVVSKYVPMKSTARPTRRRKVVVVANYDSGKARRELSGPVISLLPIVYWAELAALVVMPVLLLIRMAVSPQDTALVVFNVLLVVSMVVAVLPVVAFVFEKMAEYNEAANCNASGVAVMMEVAARVAAARDIPDEPEPVIHGEEAALAAGLVPEGAELVYDVPATADLDASMESANERLAAAKAAIAALSGKEGEGAQATGESLPAEAQPGAPAAEASAGTVQQAGQGGPGDAAAAVSAPSAFPAPVPAPAPAPASQRHNVPDWFIKGQQQAKKPAREKPVQRSRYASALTEAEEEIAAREQAHQAAAAAELSSRMRSMRESVQVASAAAGATPTGVISDIASLVTPQASSQTAPQPAPREVVEAPELVVPASSAPAPAAPVEQDLGREDREETVPVEAPAPTEASAPASSAAPVSTETAEAPSPVPARSVPEVIPSLVIPSLSAEAAPVADLSGVPAVVADDDPDVSVREVARPLTGSAAAGAASRLEGVPHPLAGQPAASPERKLVVPDIAAAPTPVVSVPEVQPQTASASRKRRTISLPNIGVSQELPRISMDDRQQAAPLSEDRPSRDGRVRDLSAVVPAVAGADSAAPAPSAESALRSALPSLAGAPAQTDAGLSGSINIAGAFSSIGATGAAAPIGDELIQDTAPDDLYVDDVDDSAYREQMTETGAIAGPGYVEMPKSRFGNLFGKLRRKNKRESTTPQQWLDVEDDFEATQVGAARGSWESFRAEDEEDLGQTVAFNPSQFDDGFDDEEDFPSSRPRARHGRSFEGGAFSNEDGAFGEEPFDAAPEAAPQTSVFGEGLPADFVFEPVPDTERIEQFHSQRIDTEVWFVALGSELAGNGGIKAFMEAHASELKGSIVVELQGLGSGKLTLIDEEGTYLPKKASSRMKRLVKKAGQACGLSVPTSKITWMDSTSAYVLKHGHQALHLAGMDGKKPALFAQEDDVAENIDAEQLVANADFVVELLKQI